MGLDEARISLFSLFKRGASLAVPKSVIATSVLRPAPLYAAANGRIILPLRPAWSNRVRLAVCDKCARASAAALQCAGETGRRRARLQRLRLAFVRRPSAQPQDVEGRAQAPVRVREAVRIDGRRALQNPTPKRLSASRMERVR